LTSPIAAEGDVEDQLLIVDVLVDIARASELSLWQTPIRWVGIAASDVRWYGVTREEVDADSFTGPFRSVDAATVRVESGAVCGSLLVLD
jgi:hypothetical protein